MEVPFEESVKFTDLSYITENERSISPSKIIEKTKKNPRRFYLYNKNAISRRNLLIGSITISLSACLFFLIVCSSRYGKVFRHLEYGGNRHLMVDDEAKIVVCPTDANGGSQVDNSNQDLCCPEAREENAQINPDGINEQLERIYISGNSIIQIQNDESGDTPALTLMLQRISNYNIIPDFWFFASQLTTFYELLQTCGHRSQESVQNLNTSLENLSIITQKTFDIVLDVQSRSANFFAANEDSVRKIQLPTIGLQQEQALSVTSQLRYNEWFFYFSLSMEGLIKKLDEFCGMVEVIVHAGNSENRNNMSNNFSANLEFSFYSTSSIRSLMYEIQSTAGKLQLLWPILHQGGLPAVVTPIEQASALEDGIDATVVAGDEQKQADTSAAQTSSQLLPVIELGGLTDVGNEELNTSIDSLFVAILGVDIFADNDLPYCLQRQLQLAFKDIGSVAVSKAIQNFQLFLGQFREFVRTMTEGGTAHQNKEQNEISQALITVLNDELLKTDGNVMASFASLQAMAQHTESPYGTDSQGLTILPAGIEVVYAPSVSPVSLMHGMLTRVEELINALTQVHLMAERVHILSNMLEARTINAYVESAIECKNNCVRLVSSLLKLALNIQKYYNSVFIQQNGPPTSLIPSDEKYSPGSPGPGGAPAGISRLDIGFVFDLAPPGVHAGAVGPDGGHGTSFGPSAGNDEAPGPDGEHGRVIENPGGHVATKSLAEEHDGIIDQGEKLGGSTGQAGGPVRAIGLDGGDNRSLGSARGHGEAPEPAEEHGRAIEKPGGHVAITRLAEEHGGVTDKGEGLGGSTGPAGGPVRAIGPDGGDSRSLGSARGHGEAPEPAEEHGRAIEKPGGHVAITRLAEEHGGVTDKGEGLGGSTGPARGQVRPIGLDGGDSRSFEPAGGHSEVPGPADEDGGVIEKPGGYGATILAAEEHGGVIDDTKGRLEPVRRQVARKPIDKQPGTASVGCRESGTATGGTIDVKVRERETGTHGDIGQTETRGNSSLGEPSRPLRSILPNILDRENRWITHVRVVVSAQEVQPLQPTEIIPVAQIPNRVKDLCKYIREIKPNPISCGNDHWAAEGLSAVLSRIRSFTVNRSVQTLAVETVRLASMLGPAIPAGHPATLHLFQSISAFLIPQLRKVSNDLSYIGKIAANLNGHIPKEELDMTPSLLSVPANELYPASSSNQITQYSEQATRTLRALEKCSLVLLGLIDSMTAARILSLDLGNTRNIKTTTNMNHFHNYCDYLSSFRVTLNGIASALRTFSRVMSSSSIEFVPGILRVPVPCAPAPPEIIPEATGRITDFRSQLDFFSTSTSIPTDENQSLNTIFSNQRRLAQFIVAGLSVYEIYLELASSASIVRKDIGNYLVSLQLQSEKPAIEDLLEALLDPLWQPTSEVLKSFLDFRQITQQTAPPYGWSMADETGSSDSDLLAQISSQPSPDMGTTIYHFLQKIKLFMQTLQKQSSALTELLSMDAVMVNKNKYLDHNETMRTQALSAGVNLLTSRLVCLSEQLRIFYLIYIYRPRDHPSESAVLGPVYRPPPLHPGSRRYFPPQERGPAGSSTSRAALIQSANGDMKSLLKIMSQSAYARTVNVSDMSTEVVFYSILSMIGHMDIQGCLKQCLIEVSQLSGMLPPPGPASTASLQLNAECLNVELEKMLLGMYNELLLIQNSAKDVRHPAAALQVVASLDLPEGDLLPQPMPSPSEREILIQILRISKAMESITIQAAHLNRLVTLTDQFINHWPLTAWRDKGVLNLKNIHRCYERFKVFQSNSRILIKNILLNADQAVSGVLDEAEHTSSVSGSTLPVVLETAENSISGRPQGPDVPGDSVGLHSTQHAGENDLFDSLTDLQVKTETKSTLHSITLLEGDVHNIPDYVWFDNFLSVLTRVEGLNISSLMQSFNMKLNELRHHITPVKSCSNFDLYKRKDILAIVQLLNHDYFAFYDRILVDFGNLCDIIRKMRQERSGGSADNAEAPTAVLPVEGQPHQRIARTPGHALQIFQQSMVILYAELLELNDGLIQAKYLNDESARIHGKAFLTRDQEVKLHLLSWKCVHMLSQLEKGINQLKYTKEVFNWPIPVKTSDEAFQGPQPAPPDPDGNSVLAQSASISSSLLPLIEEQAAAPLQPGIVQPSAQQNQASLRAGAKRQISTSRNSNDDEHSDDSNHGKRSKSR